MTGDLTVRLAAPVEYPAIGELTLRAYAFDGFVDEEDDYAPKLRDAKSRGVDAELYVATCADRVLGTVTYCPPGSRWRELARPDEAEFRMLAVDPVARGAGVGTLLVSAMIEQARDLGAAAVVLCSSTVMLTAHRLYRRVGFQRLPDRDWSPVPGIDLAAFRLAL
ncbi:MAG: GNAT family N-acetyltransferase [Sciscionella sp.]